MPLVTPIEMTEIPEKSQSGDSLITTNDIATAVEDTFINRTAINKATYPDIYGTLLSFTEGIPTIVEYFRKREAFINRQTIDTSFSGERSAVQFSFDLIHNFEIRLKEQVEIDIDPEAAEVTINGTAIIYPGFKPNVGDVFFLKLLDNRIGAFIVNTTKPLSIAHGTHYQIEFHFDTFINQDYVNKIKASVSNEYYFDKQKFFSDENALLTSVSYEQLQSLLQYRKSLISNIMNTFYNRAEKTIVVPANMYDMYLVEYLLNKIGVNDTNRSFGHFPNPFIDRFSNTIWYAFLNQDLSVLSYIAYTLIFYQQFIFDANTSNIDYFRQVHLINADVLLDARRMKQLKFNDTDLAFRTVSYVFSNRFYYTIIKSFETTNAITELTDVELQEMADDQRFYENLENSFYSVSDNAYHPIEYFDTLSTSTGSNNDIHLPEIEYLIFDFIVNNNINSTYFLENVLSKFPFVRMTSKDKLYYSAIFIHLIDILIRRLQ